MPGHVLARDESRLVGAMAWIDRALTRIDRALLVLVCLLTLAIMFIVSFDALGRYLFNRPFGFTNDLISKYMLPAALFLVFSETLRKGDHINVGIFASLMPPRLSNLLLGIAFFLSALLASVVSIEIGEIAVVSWQRNIIAFGPYPWPKWLEEAIVVVSWAVLAVRLWHAGLAFSFAALINRPELAPPMGEASIMEEGI